jgi:hypothetical protein
MGVELANDGRGQRRERPAGEATGFLRQWLLFQPRVRDGGVGGDDGVYR